MPPPTGKGPGCRTKDSLLGSMKFVRRSRVVSVNPTDFFNLHLQLSCSASTLVPPTPGVMPRGVRKVAWEISQRFCDRR